MFQVCFVFQGCDRPVSGNNRLVKLASQIFLIFLILVICNNKATSASFLWRKIHSLSRFPSLYLSSLESFSARLGEHITLWFALVPPSLQWLTEQKKPKSLWSLQYVQHDTTKFSVNNLLLNSSENKMRLNVIKAKLNSKQCWQQLSFCGGSPGKLKGLRTLQIKLQLTVSHLSYLFTSPFLPPHPTQVLKFILCLIIHWSIWSMWRWWLPLTGCHGYIIFISYNPLEHLLYTQRHLLLIDVIHP